MKLRDQKEIAVYGAAFAQRFSEEHTAQWRAAWFAENLVNSPAEREKEERRFEEYCCEQATDYAEFVVELHRRVQMIRRSKR